MEAGNIGHIGHGRQSGLVTKYSEALDKLYEKGMKSLIVERERRSLSESDKAKLLSDVETLSGCVNIGLRSEDCELTVMKNYLKMTVPAYKIEIL